MEKQDLIENLPTDDSKIDVDELYLVNTLFSNEKETITIIESLQDSLVVAFLFVLISLPILETFIKKHVPIMGKSVILLTILKMSIISILFFIIQNYALSQKSIF